MYTFCYMSTQKVNYMQKIILPLISRIKNLYDLNSDGDVAKLLEMSRNALANHKSRGTIPYEPLHTLCEKKNLSFDWLLTGEGPIFRNESQREESKLFDPSCGAGAFLSKASIEEGAFTLLSSCKGGKAYLPAHLIECLAFKPEWIEKELQARPEELCVFVIADDTMEPTLYRGDILIIGHWDNASSLKNGIYALDTGSSIIMQRLQILPEGLVKATSDNLAYQPFEFRLDSMPKDLSILGPVLWVGKKL